MSKQYFKNLETAPVGERRPLDELLDNIQFNPQGLIPVVSQDTGTGEVLMLAYMNGEALKRTIDTGRMTFWSRSRQSYWCKGETSGNLQTLVEMRLDCDGDALLCKVEQIGPACHTDRRGCFYLRVDGDAAIVEIVDEFQSEF
ncbi:MAG TPA: phosphoribosyl-AMP cyclohydrolase [Gammaproteobacteria bacterium]|nr:phosphoribosyl-AMP cyclohydrolase [Pseudomonadota bacterium]HAY45709.1 phosphoribosyl-AMP cyclohydrolase [Gammaproteobacteria bacterium]